jgi:hypothetical protein
MRMQETTQQPTKQAILAIRLTVVVTTWLWNMKHINYERTKGSKRELTSLHGDLDEKTKGSHEKAGHNNKPPDKPYWLCYLPSSWRHDCETHNYERTKGLKENSRVSMATSTKRRKEAMRRQTQQHTTKQTMLTMKQTITVGTSKNSCIPWQYVHVRPKAVPVTWAKHVEFVWKLKTETQQGEEAKQSNL